MFRRLQNLLCIISAVPALILSSALSAGDGVPDDAESTPDTAGPKIFQQDPGITDNEYVSLANFLRAVKIIRSTYVDELTYRQIFEAALRGLLQQLDPFSRYESPEHYRQAMEKSSGDYAGIGITFAIQRGIPEIIAVVQDSPADKAGIRVGDVITAIDGKVLNPARDDLLDLGIRGEKGSRLSLSVYRASDDKVHDFQMTRDFVQMNTIPSFGVCSENPEIGYIQLTSFTEHSPEEMDNAMHSLMRQNIRALILDLRDNPGGLVDSAAKICSRFLPEGALIVSLEGRLEKKAYYAEKTEKYPDMPMVVLINENSASCSEILAGCFQDYKRARILGERSFGKGSVQMFFPDEQSGAALRITTARYYTPRRQSIHGNGVLPDLEVHLPRSARIAVLNRIRSVGAAIAQASLPEDLRDTQYLGAVESLNSMLFYQDSQKANEPDVHEQDNHQTEASAGQDAAHP